MTAATVAPAPARVASPHRLTFPRALRSEWIKLTTLRSTWWSIGITAALTIGLTTLLVQAMGAVSLGGVQAAVSSVQFTMLLAGILGVIAVTGEYSTGMIRSTLAANPVRGSVLAAKAGVVATLMFAASFIINLVATLVVSPIVAGRGHPVLWLDLAETWVPMLAAAFSMAVFALIGVSFGFVLRSGAGAIAATVGLLFVLPIVASMFNTDVLPWVGEIGAYLPLWASQSLILPSSTWGLEWQVALLTLLAWAAAGLLSAWTVLRTRDA